LYLFRYLKTHFAGTVFKTSRNPQKTQWNESLSFAGITQTHPIKLKNTEKNCDLFRSSDPCRPLEMARPAPMICNEKKLKKN